jgi:hypothetical protein
LIDQPPVIDDVDPANAGDPTSIDVQLDVGPDDPDELPDDPDWPPDAIVMSEKATLAYVHIV